MGEDQAKGPKLTEEQEANLKRHIRYQNRMRAREVRISPHAGCRKVWKIVSITWAALCLLVLAVFSVRTATAWLTVWDAYDSSVVWVAFLIIVLVPIGLLYLICIAIPHKEQ